MTLRIRLRQATAGALFAAALLSATAHALEPAEFTEARTVFLQGLQGDGKAVSVASERFKALFDREPDHPLVRTYYGSCLALQGREALMPWNKLKLTESGLAQIDKALGALAPAHDSQMLGGAPVAMEVRLVAGSTFLGLPDLFRRFDAGKRVVQEAMQLPAFATLPLPMQSRFHFQASKVARQEGRRAEEAESLRRMLAADPQSPDAEAARKRMKELGA